MRIFWHQGGLHIEPEGDKERVALAALTENITFGRPAGTVIPAGESELGSEHLFERLIGDHQNSPGGLPGKPNDKKHVISIQGRSAF